MSTSVSASRGRSPLGRLARKGLPTTEWNVFLVFVVFLHAVPSRTLLLTSVEERELARSTGCRQVRQRPAQQRRTGWRSSTACGSVRPAAGLLGRAVRA